MSSPIAPKQKEESTQMAASCAIDPRSGTPNTSVPARGRLIEKEQLRLAHERACQRQSQFLPTRQRPHTRVSFVFQLHQSDHCVGGASTLSIEAAEELNSLDDLELVGELGLLKTDAEPLTELPRVGGPTPAENLGLSGIRLEEAFAYLDSSGLAGAVWTEQAEAFSRCDIEIESVDRDDVAVTLAKRSDAESSGR